MGAPTLHSQKLIECQIMSIFHLIFLLNDFISVGRLHGINKEGEPERKFYVILSKQDITNQRKINKRSSNRVHKCCIDAMITDAFYQDHVLRSTMPSRSLFRINQTTNRVSFVSFLVSIIHTHVNIYTYVYSL